VLGANANNGIVNAVMDAARWLVTPFKSLFSISDPKWNVAVNWGIGALVYSLIGGLITRLLASAGLGSRFTRSRTI
jgi:hypothetical protein